MSSNPLRAIPSVDRVLRELGPIPLPRPALVSLIRKELGEIRRAKNVRTIEAPIDRIRAAIDRLLPARIQPVINGTGIVIHTNLGRSPLAPGVVEAISQVASNYNNLEFDLLTGERGGRAAYLEHNLAVLCGAPAATVVNNCAAALVLMLRHFTSGHRKQVIISRGELIQIGGGFRIPEILEASGATLREIGTTNKTTLADYSRAISKETALILKVHHSNFYMDGFVAAAATEELSALAQKKKIPLIEDLGSGAVFSTDKIPGVAREPTPRDVLAAGVDLVCFSGDKLLGGPQAGIIAGNARYVAALKRHPLFRVLRCDKLILSGLQATVDLHLNGKHAELPIVSMMQESLDILRQRAAHLIEALEGLALAAEIGSGRAQIGGGTLPRSQIESVTIDLSPRSMSIDDFAARLRKGSPPVVGFIGKQRLKVDLRTVFPHQDDQLLAAIRAALS